MTKNQDMKKLSDQIKKCYKCSLSKTRNNPVVGSGSINSNILFIGEAPGKNEDEQGLPFVGRAGKLLDELLKSIDLNREDVYIANILKCRPPKNRNPLKNEINKCVEYLDKQIHIIQPKIIVPLGNFACCFIFNKYGLNYDIIGNIHGKIYDVKTSFDQINIIPIYHPAAVIYNPNKKEILFKDFKKIRKTLSGM